MNRRIFVVFMLLFSSACHSNQLESELQEIESQWALAYYSYPQSKQITSYQELIQRSSALAKAHPNSAKAKIIQAMIIATNAGLENAFSALKSIKQARKLLITAIKLEPDAYDGAAYVNLGTLYYMVPGWPIAFGNNSKAENLLLKALEINPNGIDSNYFYGDFLLSQNKPVLAMHYFQQAVNAPVRTNQAYADTQLRQEAKVALNNTQQRKLSNAKNLFMSLFNSAQASQ